MSAPSPAGPLLSDAARLAGEAHRLLIATLIRLESADDLVEDIPGPGVGTVDIVGLVEEAGLLRLSLQAIADWYGHAEVLRRAG